MTSRPGTRRAEGSGRMRAGRAQRATRSRARRERRADAGGAPPWRRGRGPGRLRGPVPDAVVAVKSRTDRTVSTEWWTAHEALPVATGAVGAGRKCASWQRNRRLLSIPCASPTAISASSGAWTSTFPPASSWRCWGPMVLVRRRLWRFCRGCVVVMVVLCLFWVMIRSVPRVLGGLVLVLSLRLRLIWGI